MLHKITIQCRGALQLENKPALTATRESPSAPTKSPYAALRTQCSQNKYYDDITYLIHLILNLKNDPPPKKRAFYCDLEYIQGGNKLEINPHFYLKNIVISTTLALQGSCFTKCKGWK